MRELLALVAALITIFVFVTGIPSLRGNSSDVTDASVATVEAVPAVRTKLGLSGSSLIRADGTKVLSGMWGNILLSGDSTKAASFDKRMSKFHLVNVDGTGRREYSVVALLPWGGTHPGNWEIENLEFVSASTLQLFVRRGSYPQHPHEIAGFPVPVDGLYRLSLDSGNHITAVRRVR